MITLEILPCEEPANAVLVNERAGNTPLISVGSLDIVITAIDFAVVFGIEVDMKRYVSAGENFFLTGREMTAGIAS